MNRLPSRLRAALFGLPPVYWALLAGMFVNRLASFVATFLGLYLVRARGFAPEQAAAVVALFGAGVLVGAPVGGVLADAVGRRATMLLSFATGAVCVGALGLGYGANVLAGALPPLPVYLAAGILWTVGEVVGFPYAALLVAELAPPALRGRYQGAFSMSWGIAFILSPLAGGALLSRVGAPALWGACLAAGTAAALGHLAAGPSRRRRLAADPAGPPIA